MDDVVLTVTVWTLVVAALALVASVLVPWLLWRYPRSRVRLRIEWDSPLATPPIVEGVDVPLVRCSVFNDGEAPARELALWVSNQQFPEAAARIPIGVNPYLPAGPDPWIVFVPRQPWYWDQQNRGGLVLKLSPIGLEHAARIKATVKWRRYPGHGRVRKERKLSDEAYD